jgi:hypothetical protein
VLEDVLVGLPSDTGSALVAILPVNDPLGLNPLVFSAILPGSAEENDEKRKRDGERRGRKCAGERNGKKNEKIKNNKIILKMIFN